MANLYTKQPNGARTFSGVVNPHNKENELTVFDDWNIEEMTQPTKPQGINPYLFKVMKEATSAEASIFNNL